MDFKKDDDSSDDDTILDDYRGKNGLLFLIDFREDMHQMDPILGQSYFRSSLNTCKSMMKEIARSGKDDLIGVSLIGTKKGSSDGPSLMADIQPLGSVSADRIKDIDEIIVDNGDCLKDKYGRIDKTEYLNLVKILNNCCRVFQKSTTKIYAKTLVLLTNDDDPFRSEIKLAHLARKQAARLSHAAIDLVVVGLGDDFRQNKFYNEMISLAHGEFYKDWRDTNRVKRIIDIDNHLLSLMSRLSRTNRDLIIGEISLPIALYKLYKEPKVNFKRKMMKRDDDDDYVNTSRDAGLPSTSQANTSTSDSSVQQTFQNNSQATLQKAKQDMVPLIGGKFINITRGEFENANFKIGVGLSVIGFMPSQDLPEYLTVKPPRLMLPNYFSQEGLKVFAALLEICREEKLSMLCWYKYNNNAVISLVACHPMPEQSDTRGNICQDGFCVVTLPFNDNYSDPEYKTLNVEPSDKQLAAARAIIKKLSIGYAVETFHDYQLQRTFAMIEALALDYDQVEQVTDDTILEDDPIDSRIADYIDDFNDCSHLGAFDTLSATKRPGDLSERAAKNPRLSSNEGIIEVIKEGKAETLTTALLKQALDSQGIHYFASIKKPQLIELVNNRIK